MMRTDMNYRAIVLAAAISLVASSLYYIVFSEVYLGLLGIDPSTAAMAPRVWEIVGQFVRNAVVALALAYLLRRLGVDTWGGALRLAVLLWVGFEAMAVFGSVLHEDYPLGLYAIHVGDALMTTTIMSLVLVRRRPRAPRSEPAPAVTTPAIR